MKQIARDTLEKILAESGTTGNLSDIIEEPMATRELLNAGLSSSIDNSIKKLCSARHYILFDCNIKDLSVRVIAKEDLRGALHDLFEEYDEEMLNLIATEKAYEISGRELFSTEYYERLITAIQSEILQGSPTNWYIEMSDYIIDEMYRWYGEKAILEYIQSEPGGIDLFLRKERAETFLRQLQSKVYDVAEKEVTLIIEDHPIFNEVMEQRGTLRVLVNIRKEQDVLLPLHTFFWKSSFSEEWTSVQLSVQSKLIAALVDIGVTAKWIHERDQKEVVIPAKETESMDAKRGDIVYLVFTSDVWQSRDSYSFEKAFASLDAAREEASKIFSEADNAAEMKAIISEVVLDFEDCSDVEVYSTDGLEWTA